jgi:UDP-N-acetylenolpyruvoylglucosamine reductase
MRYVVAELEGALLDAAVAEAEGWTWKMDGYESEDTGERINRVRTNHDSNPLRRAADGSAFSPSGDWSHGGPFIEREGIAFVPLQTADISPAFVTQWQAALIDGARAEGPTHLIAAMRAKVASKFGDHIDL